VRYSGGRTELCSAIEADGGAAPRRVLRTGPATTASVRDAPLAKSGDAISSATSRRHISSAMIEVM